MIHKVVFLGEYSMNLKEIVHFPVVGWIVLSV